MRQTAPLPLDEDLRLAALHDLGLLDTEPEPCYDRIVLLAKRIFDVPIALVTLVDKDRQFFKACDGLDVRETSREVSFCAHALLRDDIMIVTDARSESRFSSNPLVIGEPGIRFYAGAPLITPQGHAIGTLCLVDLKPRHQGLNQHDQTMLRDLAGIIMDISLLRAFGIKNREA